MWIVRRGGWRGERARAAPPTGQPGGGLRSGPQLLAPLASGVWISAARSMQPSRSLQNGERWFVVAESGGCNASVLGVAARTELFVARGVTEAVKRVRL